MHNGLNVIIFLILFQFIKTSHSYFSEIQESRDIKAKFIYNVKKELLLN